LSSFCFGSIPTAFIDAPSNAPAAEVARQSSTVFASLEWTSLPLFYLMPASIKFYAEGKAQLESNSWFIC
jgi:hypothetical protein